MLRFFIHDPLKLSKGIFQTKWQKLQFIQIILPTMIDSPKCCFNLITFLQWQLMVAIPQSKVLKALA